MLLAVAMISFLVLGLWAHTGTMPPLVVVESSSAVVSVTAGSETSGETEVSVAYCVADCAPQPATTTIRKVAEIFASFTVLTLVVRDPQKSEAH